MHIKDSETRGNTTTGALTARSGHTVGPSQVIPTQDRGSTPPADGAGTITVYEVNTEAGAHVPPITAEAFDQLSALGLEIRQRALVEYKAKEDIIERYYVNNLQTDADERLYNDTQSKMADLRGLIKNYHVFDFHSDTNKDKSNLSIAESQRAFIDEGNRILQTAPSMSIPEPAGVDRPETDSPGAPWSLEQ